MTERSYHHGDLRNALIKAALVRLEKGGTDALSLRGLAERVGVSRTAPYRHFAGKDALLAVVAASGFARFAEALRAAKGRNAGKRLAALGRAYFAFARQNPGLLRLMFGPREGPDRSSPELVAASGDAYAELYGAVCAVLEEEGLPLDRAHVASLAAWSLVHGLSHLMLDQALHPSAAGGLSEEALVNAITDAGAPLAVAMTLKR